jgi:hypothetical protein
VLVWNHLSPFFTNDGSAGLGKLTPSKQIRSIHDCVGQRTLKIYIKHERKSAL